MMSRVWALALNTYREAIRQKVLYVLVFFALVLISFSFVLAQISMGEDTKVIKDLGLASIILFGALVSIFVGIGLIYKEVDRRTVYTILSKPVSRGEFVLGKFFGLVLTVGLEVFLMTSFMFMLLWLYVEPLDFQILKAVLMIYFELWVLISVALLFSSYSSSFISALFSVAFLLIGHITDDFATLMTPRLRDLYAHGDSLAGDSLSLLVRVLKVFSLDHFSINAEVVHGVAVPWARIGFGFAYAVGWVVILLTIATWLFKRKDLK